MFGNSTVGLHSVGGKIMLSLLCVVTIVGSNQLAAIIHSNDKYDPVACTMQSCFFYFFIYHSQNSSFTIDI